MLVLLTRAAADAERSAARLRQRGHDSLISPVLRIVDVDADIPARAYDAVMLTSAQAAQSRVAAGLSPALKALPLWVVGAKTLDAARHAGFSGRALLAADAAALLGEIVRGGKIGGPALYLAGAERKPDLEAGLAELGVAVAACVVYAAEAQPILSDAALDGFAQGRIDAVLHYSRRSAALFAQAAASSGVALDAVRHFCLSAEVAKGLPEAVRCIVAAEPTERALFDALG